MGVVEWNATAVATVLVDNVPVNEVLGVRVLVADSGRASTTLDDVVSAARPVAAGALTALAQAAAQAAVISTADEAAQVHHAQTTAAAVELALLAPAHGRLTATCVLTGDDVDAARAVYADAEDTVSITTEVSVCDASGWLVASARLEWLVERSEVAPPTAANETDRRQRWLALVGR